MSDKYAFVTLATNDTYSLGALVLAYSLKRVHTSHHLVIMITPSVSPAMRTLLNNVFNEVVEVDVLDSGDKENLRLLKRPELGVTFTKLHCWKLTKYDKCVFLDADTLVLQNVDELFEREELSAAPDIGWPDCFNSGVFVYKPSIETFGSLITFALQHGSFDGGDQGLLNMYFSNWSTADIKKHLPFVYNLCSAALYSYLPAFKWFGHNIKIIHFISGAKPWLQSFNPQTRTVQAPVDSPHLRELLQLWWDIFCVHVHPSLSTDMSGVAKTFAVVKLDEPISEEQLILEDQLRRQNWEQGNIDYLGKDSFSNIWAKIQQTISSHETKPSSNDETSSAEVSKSKSEVSVEAAPVSPQSSQKEEPKIDAPSSEQIDKLTAKLDETKISEPEPSATKKVTEKELVDTEKLQESESSKLSSGTVISSPAITETIASSPATVTPAAAKQQPAEKPAELQSAVISSNLESEPQPAIKTVPEKTAAPKPQLSQEKPSATAQSISSSSATISPSVITPEKSTEKSAEQIKSSEEVIGISLKETSATEEGKTSSVVEKPITDLTETSLPSSTTSESVSATSSPPTPTIFTSPTSTSSQQSAAKPKESDKSSSVIGKKK